MRLLAAALALSLMAGGVAAQPSPQVVAVSEAPIIANFAGEVGGTGPYPARGYADPRLATHTIYAPVALPRGVKLPVVAWANGGCADNGVQYEQFLREVASHGYLVISIGPARERPARPAAPAAAPNPAGPGPGDDPTRSSQLIDAIDFAAAENGQRGSRFFHALDLTRVAVMGHSCGGLQALDVTRDPRVTTTVVMDSGIYVRPGGRSGVRLTKDRLNDLHGPALYVIGGPTDIAYVNAMDDYARITTAPVFMLNRPVGHGGTFQQPNGGPWGEAVSAWLAWRLKGDITGARYFLGPDCGPCRDPAWSLQVRNTP